MHTEPESIIDRIRKSEIKVNRSVISDLRIDCKRRAS